MSYRDLFFKVLDNFNKNKTSELEIFIEKDKVYIHDLEYGIPKSSLKSIIYEYFRNRKTYCPKKEKSLLYFRNEVFSSSNEFFYFIESLCQVAVVTKTVYRPKIYKENGIIYVNKWEYPKILKEVENKTAKKSDKYEYNIQMFKKFVLSLCGKDEYSMNYLLQWTKEIMYEKAKHDIWIILVNFHQGTGKTTYCEILSGIMEGCVSSAKTSQIEGRFNSFLDGKVLCYVSEYNPCSKDQEYIKSLSDGLIDIEGKGKEIITKRNFTNFIFSTNREDIFSTIDIDRRKAVIVGEKGKEDKNYERGFLREEYPEIVEWLASNSSRSKEYNKDFLTDLAIFFYENSFLPTKVANAPKPNQRLEDIKEQSKYDLVNILENFCYEVLGEKKCYPISSISKLWKEYASTQTNDFKTLYFFLRHKEYSSDVFRFKIIKGERFLEVLKERPKLEEEGGEDITVIKEEEHPF